MLSVAGIARFPGPSMTMLMYSIMSPGYEARILTSKINDMPLPMKCSLSSVTRFPITASAIEPTLQSRMPGTAQIFDRNTLCFMKESASTPLSAREIPADMPSVIRPKYLRSSGFPFCRSFNFGNTSPKSCITMDAVIYGPMERAMMDMPESPFPDTWSRNPSREFFSIIPAKCPVSTPGTGIR